MSNSREDKQRKLIEHALGLSPEGDALSRLGEAFSATQDPGFDRDSLAEYVAGTANAEQRETVEAAMAIDPAIRAEVDAMLATKAELELAGSYGPTTAAPRNKSSWLTWGGWATATAAIPAWRRFRAICPAFRPRRCRWAAGNSCATTA